MRHSVAVYFQWVILIHGVNISSFNQINTCGANKTNRPFWQYLCIKILWFVFLHCYRSRRLGDVWAWFGLRRNVHHTLTLMLLVQNLTNAKWLKPWRMDTHLRVLSVSYPMNTNMTGFTWFSKIFVSLFWTKIAIAWEGLNHLIPIDACIDHKWPVYLCYILLTKMFSLNPYAADG